MSDSFDSLHHHYIYVDTQTQLDELCFRLKTLPTIFIDTEFVRSKTLYPMLGLFQVFDGEQVYLIDPQAVDNMNAMADIMANPDILKVIHSCSEDLDAIKHHLDVYPSPVFDTQIAAGYMNLGNSLGYANLVENFCQVTLDKTESRTDWIARPLRQEQLIYAAADVTFLQKVFNELAPQIEAKNMTQCIYDEVALMVAKKDSPLPSELAYLSVSNNWKMRGHRLLALKLMSEWRIQEAQSKNIAINFVLRESAMTDVAQKMPQNMTQLSKVFGLTPKQKRLYSNKILSMVAQANDADDSELPEKIERLIEFPKYKKAVSEIKAICAQQSEKLDIPDVMLASKKQINDLLKWTWFQLNENEARGLKPDLLSGWRGQLLSKPLAELFNPNTGEFHAIRSL